LAIVTLDIGEERPPRGGSETGAKRAFPRYGENVAQQGLTPRRVSAFDANEGSAVGK
jgi:hypothetical protein